MIQSKLQSYFVIKGQAEKLLGNSSQYNVPCSCALGLLLNVHSHANATLHFSGHFIVDFALARL